MKIDQILESKKIEPERIIFSITAEEALSKIEEALDKFELSVDFEEFSNEEIETILSEYAYAVLMFHPDAFHQERIVIIKNREIFIRHGLDEDDIDRLDFTG